MTTFIVGFSTMLIVYNIILISIESLHISYYVIDMISILGNHTINNKCYFNDSICYDYRKYGKLHESCVKSYMSANCSNRGRTMFPMQYNTWKLYLETNGSKYPKTKAMVVVCLVWIFIGLLASLKLKLLGTVSNFASKFKKKLIL